MSLTRKVKTLVKSFLSICCVGLFFSTSAYTEQDSSIFKQPQSSIVEFLKQSKPLTEIELKKLVIGNSIVGHTCHGHAIYELYFKKDGTLIFRKSRHHAKVYYGKWWIKGDSIFSQWPTYKHKPTVNHLHYYHLTDNIYVPYNINEACGPANTFGIAFMAFQGNPFGVL